MDYKKYIAEKLKVDGVTQDELYDLIALPPNSEMGDYAIPCFKFAKLMRKSPVMIAQELKESVATDDVISEVSAVNGYLNFKINKDGFVRSTLEKIFAEGERYGASNEGAGKTVCIDYSSINIAKPFHIGHLSTTVLGGALYRIFNFLGYKAVGINHLGDYGTQFGKLISAYKRWGDKETVEKGGIRALNELYVRFHKEAEDILNQIFQKNEFSTRRYYRVLKLARTIADLEGCEEIRKYHLTEAYSYCNIGKKYWRMEE